MFPGISPVNAFDERSRNRRFRGKNPGISPVRRLSATLKTRRFVRLEISGERLPEKELYWRKTDCRRVHRERGGTVPLKKLERRLSLRSIRRLTICGERVPLSWRLGRRSSLTRRLEQPTPRQSQGADGVEASQPLSTPSGSRRLILTEVKAWISASVSAFSSAHVKRGAEISIKNKIAASAAMYIYIKQNRKQIQSVS